LERALAPFRARSTLLSLIALLCLPLAAVGLTGALLLFVRSRERENAIRIALGAEPAAVRRAVVGRSLVMVALGLLPGIGLGAALANVVAHQLFNVYPIDPLTILLVGVSFLVLGWLAALVPSRRAFELQPAHLLRSN
jgi:putative ABC transport system permease protein